MENQLQQGEAESQATESRQAQMLEDVEACRSRLAELEQQSDEARQRLEAKSRERDSLQTDLRQREGAIETARLNAVILKLLK